MSLTSVLGAGLVKWQGPAQRPLSQPAYKMERSDLHICTHRQAHPSHAEAAIGYTGRQEALTAVYTLVSFRSMAQSWKMTKE